MKPIAHSPKKRIHFLFFTTLLLAIGYWLYAPSASADDWLEGSAGYEQGVAQAKSANQPMLILFYTDWCGYCRKLQKNVLDKPEVQKALSHFVKVRINPEKGDGENHLAGQYGIQGYPSVYLENQSAGVQPQDIGGATRSARTFIEAVRSFEGKDYGL